MNNLKSLITQFLYHLAYDNLTQINSLLEEDCIYTNHDKSILGKEKVINYLKDKRNIYNVKHISILNSVQDSKDTLLISYHVITEHETSPIYGSAVVRINDSKIGYIKNYIVK